MKSNYKFKYLYRLIESGFIIEHGSQVHLFIIIIAVIYYYELVNIRKMFNLQYKGT